jgi:PIN domain nuclease of toxin-antitoxin system
MALAARAENRLAISAISFWEIALLVAKDRLELRDRPVELRLELLATGVIELALTGDIALLAVELENLHGDPADRFIAATAIAHGATLMTADARLLRWRSEVKRQNAET